MPVSIEHKQRMLRHLESQVTILEPLDYLLDALSIALPYVERRATRQAVLDAATIRSAIVKADRTNV